MDAEIVAAVVIATGGVLGTWLQVGRPRRGPFVDLKHALELLQLLPDSSAAKNALAGDVDRRVLRMIEDSREKRRDPTGIGLGLFFMVLAIALAITSVLRGGGWWWLVVPAVFIGLLGTVGFIQDVTPHKRDEGGRAIE